MTTKIKPINIASLMMLVWLAFYVLATFFAVKWADFIAIIGCTVPMLAFGKGVRGETFGTRDCNTLKYKEWDYVFFFAFTISGCALISALTYLVTSLGYVESVQGRSDFLYMAVFYCFIPAFFEEWFVRGGILGTLSRYRAAGVWVTAVFFMLMHADTTKYLYALFAGLFITSLVYLTECVYVGMILHLVNNFTALLLSYLPSGRCEYIALIIILAVFVTSLLLARKTSLFTDVCKLLTVGGGSEAKEIWTPLFRLTVLLCMGVMVFKCL